MSFPTLARRPPNLPLVDPRAYFPYKLPAVAKLSTNAADLSRGYVHFASKPLDSLEPDFGWERASAIKHTNGARQSGAIVCDVQGCGGRPAVLLGNLGRGTRS